LGARVGNAFVALHRSKGVVLRLGQGVAALHGDGAVHEVELEGGERLPADLVVIGFGIRPATGYLQGVGIGPDGSLSVGPDLRVAEDLYAAGDIARFPLYGDGEPIRVEHWRVAEQHGRVAALNMAGRPTHYSVTPAFWTIQYLKRLDCIGHASEWDDVVVHGDLEKPEFLAYYVRNGRVVAAAGLDRDQDTAALIELFNQRRDWTARELGAQPSRLLGKGSVSR
jgi:apoptosis-inducing factor 3